ncbi:MAG TPA: hypothetical protein DCE42_02325 [Myxococcales bacterium]|nr:hypothetical protein [Deltaproteobacteria bacterium]MBK07322.1 hypothetical protein [Deltaproteobacteria bacterium]MBU53260.1 hypothetical protein [Deltaproteobacteria bacterium]HAA53560.1 hypothetical protein [Myxococcales bacterium]|tara:strand:+ start:17760 stop:18104 length:345 start_codon:yes stop_codon:yes gene_type:complete
MILSFALTTEELLSGAKTVTRRDFAPTQLARWQAQYDKDPDKLHQAWDKVPFAGGQRIGEFRLTYRPYLERLRDMPVEDLEAEGGMVETIEEFAKLIGKNLDDEVTVIRFEKVD